MYLYVPLYSSVHKYNDEKRSVEINKLQIKRLDVNKIRNIFINQIIFDCEILAVYKFV